jgi:transcriptional regulator with XRE-family HTH domain
MGETLVEAAQRLGGIGAAGHRASPASVRTGQLIRSERQARGLTQQQLAGLAGLAQSDISKIERGGGSDGPSVRVVEQIAAALGISIPIGPASAEPVIIEGDEDVCASSVAFRDIVPLISSDDLEAMRTHVSAFLRAEKINKHALKEFSQCKILRVDHHGRGHKLRTVTGPVVIATFSGHAKYHTPDPTFRENLVIGIGKEPVSILGVGQVISVEAAFGDDASVVIMPAGALLASKSEMVT